MSLSIFHRRKVFAWTFSIFALVFCLAAVIGTPLTAQTVTVKLLSASSGKPLSDQNVTFQWGAALASTVVSVNHEGLGKVQIPPGVTTFSMVPGPKTGSEPYRIAYLNCNVSATSHISIQEVMKKGLVPKNVCNDRSVNVLPGEVVFWGRLRRFWEPDMQ